MFSFLFHARHKKWGISQFKCTTVALTGKFNLTFDLVHAQFMMISALQNSVGAGSNSQQTSSSRRKYDCMKISKSTNKICLVVLQAKPTNSSSDRNQFYYMQLFRRNVSEPRTRTRTRWSPPAAPMRTCPWRRSWRRSRRWSPRRRPTSRPTSACRPTRWVRSTRPRKRSLGFALRHAKKKKKMHATARKNGLRDFRRALASHHASAIPLMHQDQHQPAKQNRPRRETWRQARKRLPVLGIFQPFAIFFYSYYFESKWQYTKYAIESFVTKRVLFLVRVVLSTI